MAVGARDREVFRRIAEVESEPPVRPTSFREAVATLDRLIRRRRALFGDRWSVPSDDEFRAHEELYGRARALRAHRG